MSSKLPASAEPDTNTDTPARRIILLMSPATYRANAFTEAGARIGLELVRATDLPPELATHWHVALGIDFSQPEAALERIVAVARDETAAPVLAVLAIDDRGALIAAQASVILGLSHNDPGSALAARDKFLMRERLTGAGVPVPEYRRYPASTDPVTVAAAVADAIAYPCVVKPLLLSGSRGVIRADDPAQFVAAFARTRRIVEASGMAAAANDILVERFVPGPEVALEGLLTDGTLTTLALFDKPDPLDGPFFEETIYVTPSRLPHDIQAAVSARAAAAAAAVGLRHGPVHVELRIDLDRGEIWTIELAGRSIGGLCSSVLEFGAGVNLEELILRHAARLPLHSLELAADAAGVMMIPIPRGGILRRVDGIDGALAVDGVTGVEITAPLNGPIVPLPEGESYLGFIFAKAETPALAEAALREAHARLTFRIDPMITLIPA